MNSDSIGDTNSYDRAEWVHSHFYGPQTWEPFYAFFPRRLMSGGLVTGCCYRDCIGGRDGGRDWVYFTLEERADAILAEGP